jgi:RND family efflux transporter MFP subunit
MTVSKQILLSIAVVLVAVGGWYLFGHSDWAFRGGAAPASDGQSAASGARPGGQAVGGARRAGDVPVIAARVGVDTSGQQIRALGTLTAAEAVTLYPEVTGIVVAVEVAPGASVARGQVLFRLNTDDQAIAIDRATIAVEDARAALDRAERLSRSNNVSEVALSDARTALRTAEIDLRSAEIEHQKRIVKAPFAGVVGLIPVSVGDFVSTSTALTTLDDVSSLTMTFDATERFVGKVKVGHPVAGTAIGLPGRKIKGEISAVDSRVDPSTRVFKVEATLEEGIEGLKPGMSITVVVDFEGEAQATVPSLAIQWDRNGAYVWVLDGDTARRAAVEIVGRRSGVVIVSGDLATGTEVVVEGLQRMREGISVRRVGDQPEIPEDSPVSSSSGDDASQPPTASIGDRTG